ncbi:hypothetical protein EPN29_08475 [bacterium]|nr:MAG: hypothetical protein EPN29_08475 [bacterium]
MQAKPRVVKRLYRLSVEPRVVDQLVRIASRTGEPKSRLATRLFTEAVMAARPPSKTPARSARTPPGTRSTPPATRRSGRRRR